MIVIHITSSRFEIFQYDFRGWSFLMGIPARTVFLRKAQNFEIPYFLGVNLETPYFFHINLTPLISLKYFRPLTSHICASLLYSEAAGGVLSNI